MPFITTLCGPERPGPRCPSSLHFVAQRDQDLDALHRYTLWPREAVELLISLYEEFEAELEDPKTRKKTNGTKSQGGFMQQTTTILKTKSKVSGDHSSNPTKRFETVRRQQDPDERHSNFTLELSQS